MQPNKDKQTISLAQMPAGKLVEVVSIDGGYGLKNRLASMGILAHSTFRVLRNEGAGRLIVAIKNSKVVIGRGASSNIFVRECE
jgi:ferrous iron transport protein A